MLDSKETHNIVNQVATLVALNVNTEVYKFILRSGWRLESIQHFVCYVVLMATFYSVVAS